VGVGFGVGLGVGVLVGQGDGVGVGGGVHVGFIVGVGQFVGVGVGKIIVVNVSSLGVAETKFSSTHIADATKIVRMEITRSKIVILPFPLYVGVTSSPFKQKSEDLTIKL
jgi:hypothetical protein